MNEDGRFRGSMTDSAERARTCLLESELDFSRKLLRPPLLLLKFVLEGVLNGLNEVLLEKEDLL